MPSSGRPRHEEISDHFREQIETGALLPNEQLPSEHELCDQFDVSRVTVRRALQTLENEGLIYRRQGVGSFVAEVDAKHGLVRLTDFAQDMAKAGLEARSEVVRHEQTEAPPRVARQLAIDPEQPVVRLDRRRLGDGHVVAFDRTWLPLFYGQLLEGHDLEETTIYRILEDAYDIPVLGGHYRIEAVCADETLAEPLAIDEGRPLLLIRRLSYTEGEKPIYVQERYYRTDRIAYELELARHPDRRVSSSDGHALRELAPVFKDADEPAE
jgi:GntR family transcriptional regulator